jgi:aryl-alcohol dehydrogenase-like predicted oxidoreductase
MEYRTLGRTDLEISRLILGCGNFGGIGSDPRFFETGEDADAAFALMDRAADLGITVFDTADAYGGGRSEETIGRWLAAKGSAARDAILVSSKVGNSLGDPNDKGGLSAARIKKRIEGSLRRLRTDRLDMYLIHQPDPDTPVEETLNALTHLVSEGKVRFIGASNITASGLREALAASERHGLARFDWVQNNYSLLERDQETEVLPLCEERCLGFTPFSPLAGGWLTGKYDSIGRYPPGSRMTLRPEPYGHLEHEGTLSGLSRLRQAAEQREVSMAALAMAWALEHPALSGIVIGPRHVTHLEEAVTALDIRLDESERADLTALFPR